MTKAVLFVCVENSCRSQLAEAFGHIHNPGGIEFYSAGSKPSGVVNPKAIEVMAELDYDLSAHKSQSLDEVPQERYTAVITMGCGDKCPWIEGDIREDWALDDPKHFPLEQFRQTRDTIGEKVQALIARIA